MFTWLLVFSILFFHFLCVSRIFAFLFPLFWLSVSPSLVSWVQSDFSKAAILYPIAFSCPKIHIPVSVWSTSNESRNEERARGEWSWGSSISEIKVNTVVRAQILQFFMISHIKALITFCLGVTFNKSTTCIICQGYFTFTLLVFYEPTLCASGSLLTL